MKIRKAKYFLSYARKELDQKFARCLVEAFKEQGLQVWRDTEQIDPGDVLSGRIKNGIKLCQRLICLVSTSTDKSVWCSRELSYASDHKKPIVAVVLVKGAAMPEETKGLVHIDVSAEVRHAEVRHEDFHQAVTKVIEQLRPSRRSPRLPGSGAEKIETPQQALEAKLAAKLARLAKLNTTGKCPFALLGAVYLDILVDPIRTDYLADDEWRFRNPVGLRLGGSAAWVGHYLHANHQRQSHLFSLVSKEKSHLAQACRDFLSELKRPTAGY